MKISLDWLKQYINFTETPEELAEILTQIGLEVEGLEKFEEIQGNLAGLVIGEVLTCEKHPNADKLSKTTVDIGAEAPSPIVCGAPNVAKGQKVIVATVGATLYPIEGDAFKIKKAKIRGEASQGMICAEDEIGLGKSHEGIMVLNTDLPNGTPASAYFNLFQDHIVEIGLTPNRADATSHIGVARDLKVILKQAIQKPDTSHFKIDNTSNPVEITVENTEACPRYSGITISNVSVQDSPKWLQNRLKSIGLSPINNIVDITNFILHEYGQPLHAFDLDKIEGKKVMVKTLPKDTVFTTLDEKERKLSDKDLMICNETEGMCIAGVFGGMKSGVKSETQNIFLESAYFNPDFVRKTSQLHGLKTDASFRYERGADPNITIEALKRASMLIKEIAGGEISSEIIDIYPNPIKDFDIKITYKNIDRLIGVAIDRNEIKRILQDLEIQIVEENEAGLQITVPPYRVDVQREADIIEEIARIYGYNNIEISENLGADFLANFPAIDKDKTQTQIAELLASNGFYEMITNSLTSSKYSEVLDNTKSEENVVILNKLSEDLDVMRQSLLFSGLEVLAHNINRRQSNLKFFEFGKTYHKTDKGYQESTKLAIFITGNQAEESWMQASEKVDFHTLASAVQKVLQKMNLGEIQSKTSENTILDYGLTYVGKKRAVAELGLVKDKYLKVAEIKQPVFYAELDWEYLLKQYDNSLEMSEISKFPEVRRDLSLVLDKRVSFAEIKNLALQREKKLLKSVNVFDVYEGKNIEEGKKAYALSFILEDKSKTLTDKAIDKTMKKLMFAFEKELGALIRK